MTTEQIEKLIELYEINAKISARIETSVKALEVIGPHLIVLIRSLQESTEDLKKITAGYKELLKPS